MDTRSSLDEHDLGELSHSLRQDLLRRGVDEPTADDVVQEAWLRALRRPPPDPSGIRGWMHVVVRRLLRDQRRAGRNRAARERDVARGERMLATEPEDEGPVLRHARGLPEPYRTVLYLHFIEDRDVDEIAIALGRPVETVRSQLRRGLERVRQRTAGGTDRRQALAVLAWLSRSGRSPQRGGLELGSLVAGAGLSMALVLLAWQVGFLGAERAEPQADTVTVTSAPERAELALRPESRSPIAAAAALEAERTGVPPAVVSGTVRAPSGEPVPGARVDAAAASGFGAPRAVFTDGAGRYAIELGRDELLSASHADWGDSRRTYAACAESGADFDLHLAPALGRVLVRVQDHEGAPVAGARVVSAAARSITQILGRDARIEYPGRSPEAITDGGGRARVPAFREGTAPVELVVARPGGPAWRGPIPDDPPEPFVVQLPRPARIHGRCVDAAGRAASGAHVEVVQLGGASCSSAEAGPGGTFELRGLSPGPFVLRATQHPAQGPRSTRIEGQLAEGEELERLCTLQDDASVHGIALGLAGPIEGALVVLEPLGANEAEEALPRRTRTDAAGRFSFGGCAPVGHSVRASSGADDLEVVQLVVRPRARELLLRLQKDEPRSPLVLEFDGAEDGVPMHVDLVRDDPAISISVAADAGGRRFVSPPLPAGRYRVVGWRAGLGVFEATTIEHDPRVAAVHRLAAAGRGRLEVELDLPAGVSFDDVAGFVHVPGFRRFALSGLGRSVAQHEFVRDTARRLLSIELAAGKYGFAISGPGLTGLRRNVEVGDRSTVRLRLAPELGARAKIVCSSPRELAEYEVVVIEVQGPREATEYRVAARHAFRIEGGFWFHAPLPHGATGIRIASERADALRSGTAHTILHGERTLDGQSPAATSFEVTLVERAN